MTRANALGEMSPTTKTYTQRSDNLCSGLNSIAYREIESNLLH